VHGMLSKLCHYSSKEDLGCDYEVCTGCGKCLRVCQTHAIDFNWFVEVPSFMERLTEYALGAISGKKDRVGFFNFLLNITPDCDCVPWSDAPLVPDIGILASRDPVAIDQASFDLVNSQTGIENTLLRKTKNLGRTSSRASGRVPLVTFRWEYGVKTSALETENTSLLRFE